MKKILHTFFFGYAAFKYRRLIRTPLIILLIGILLIGINSIVYYPFGKDAIIEKMYKEYPLLVSSTKNYYTEKEAYNLLGDSLSIYIKEGRLKKVKLSKNEFIDFLKDDEIDDNVNNRITAINALLMSINKDNFFNKPKYNYSNGNENWYDISDYEFRQELGITPFFDGNRTFKELLILIVCSLLVVGFISFIIEPFISEKTKNKMNKTN